MALNVSIGNVGDLTNPTSAAAVINSNFTNLQNTLADALSRSGTSPNQMASVLDMNNNPVINVPKAVNATSPLRQQDLLDFVNEGQVVFQSTTIGTSQGIFNVKDFGALGNGTGDDGPAFNQAIVAAQTAGVAAGGSGGGTVFIPLGAYLINTPIVVPNTPVNIPVRIEGLGHGSWLIAAHDINLLTINAQLTQVENVLLQGVGIGATSFGANGTVLHLTQTAGGCRLNRVFTQGGGIGILIESNDVEVFNTFVGPCYGTAHFQISNSTGNDITAGLRVEGCGADTASPPLASLIPVGTAFPSNWQASHSYNRGDLVFTNQLSQTWLLQCVTAGISGSNGSLPPNLANYFEPITENSGGTAVWNLGGPIPHFCFLFDSGSSEALITKTDMSGFGCSTAVRIQDVLNPGNPPILIHLRDSIFSPLFNGVEAVTGQGLYISGCETYGGPIAGSSAVVLESGFTQAVIDGCDLGKCPIGISITGGPSNSTKTVIANNQIFGCTTGVSVNANISDFVISNNSIVGNTNSVVVASGTSDRYLIQGNLVTGSTPTDGGSGTHKFVGNNF